MRLPAHMPYSKVNEVSQCLDAGGLTYNGSDGSRRRASSTTLKSWILWSGADGPQVTINSSLLASQHVAVIFDAAVPALWPMLRRFLILAVRPLRLGPNKKSLH